jgi:hypothetical protein
MLTVPGRGARIVARAGDFALLSGRIGVLLQDESTIV